MAYAKNRPDFVFGYYSKNNKGKKGNERREGREGKYPRKHGRSDYVGRRMGVSTFEEAESAHPGADVVHN